MTDEVCGRQSPLLMDCGESVLRQTPPSAAYTSSVSKLTAFAKELRKNMTRHERHLWYDFLKTLPITVHRQKIIGSYIVNFYIAERKLVIELDGSQHYDFPGKQADARRDAYLRKQGLTVLRYANSDIDHNFEGVCTDILAHL